jgi:hypothetical protein
MPLGISILTVRQAINSPVNVAQSRGINGGGPQITSLKGHFTGFSALSSHKYGV